MRKTSHELLLRIPILHYELKFKVKEICIIFGMQNTCVYKALADF